MDRKCSFHSATIHENNGKSYLNIEVKIIDNNTGLPNILTLPDIGVDSLCINFEIEDTVITGTTNNQQIFHTSSGKRVITFKDENKGYTIKEYRPNKDFILKKIK